MDKNSSMQEMAAHAAPIRPAIALANWYQFQRGEKILLERVESRFFLWCRSGAGSLKVNDKTFNMQAGDWIFMPWGHRLLYGASAPDPFFVGGVHIIPRCLAKLSQPPAVPHSRLDPLAGCSSRRDALLPGLEGIVAGRSDPRTSRLLLLASYVIEVFQDEWRTQGADALAGRLLAEIRRESGKSPAPARPRPQALVRMRDFAMAHLASPVRLDDMLRIGGCAPTTAHRLFVAFEGMPPMRWLMLRRLDQAVRLLCTTSLRITEIARACGFDDPFHFSRAFRNHHGLSPIHYRRAHPRF